MNCSPKIPKILALLCAFAASPLLLETPSPAFAQSSQTAASQRFPEIPKSPDYLPTVSKLNRVEDATLAEMRANFANPGVDFATAPLWTWNDLLTEEQIRGTLQDLARQNVMQAYVHPRPGLMTPYLSDEWFALWNVALDEARKLGMKIWIYDENSYPSGFAGGFVPDAFPESRGSGLDVVLYDSLVDANGNWLAGETVLYIFEELSDGTAVDRTQEILDAKTAGTPIPPKSETGVRWVVSRLQYAGTSRWYGGKTYVNLLTNGVLDAFINITHEKYRDKFSSEFGKLIPGAFTDEPQIAPAGMFSWTDDFPQEFEKRRGYSLLPKLSALVAPVGDWKRIRYDYYRTALELYVERWQRPFAAYCERNNLEYTGHDFEHEWPNAHMNPDNMATAFWRQRPAVDLLMNNFSRGTHSQFGNVRAVRELASVVRQSGRSRALSENYGAGGYDLRFEDMKRLGDWSYALGVNATDEHLSYVTIRGARKHDHPQTFSYHSAWFAEYSKMADYWTRLSYLLSRGKLSEERFLLIEPTTTAWFYQHNAGDESGKLGALGDGFADLLNRLEAEQVDYDLGSEDVIGRIGSVATDDDKTIYRVGTADYRVVVLPPQLENLDAATFALLADFAERGGRVLSLGANFERVGGAAFENLTPEQKAAFEKLTAKIETVDFENLVATSQAQTPVAVVAKSNKENVFHMTRQTSDSRIVFLCNVDMNAPASVELALNADWRNAGIEIFDPQTGTRRVADGNAFELPPCGSLALVVSNGVEKANEIAAPKAAPHRFNLWKFADRVRVNPLDDNVLVLDYLTLKRGEQTLENEYFYRANAWLWRQNGFDASPWDNGVQFEDELLRHKFADDSGFEVSYRFVKSDAPIPDLRFVVENPDDFKVYVNGEFVERLENEWKFDRSFGVYDVAKFAKPGENEIRLVAEKMTIFCEIMPAWIVGAFSLESREKGFEIVADKGLAFQSDENEKREVRASSAAEGVAWLSSGVDYDKGVRDLAPRLSFAFSNEQKIDAVQIWNYCEANLAKRGVKRFTIPGIGAFDLKIGDGSAQIVEFAEPIRVAPGGKLEFVVDENFNAVSFPLPENYVGSTAPQSDNAFVGVAEVRFLTRDENGAYKPLAERPTVAASSELTSRSHNRRANLLVDGSGLETSARGWAAQGRPFYSGAVDYTATVEKSELPNDAPLLFALPEIRERWNGAVAAILVDGRQVGSIAFPTETVDLTQAVADALKSESTFDLTVRVYGTPKNQFGPHHAGKLRGSAWPGSFHGAPATQPSGRDYDVIEYGFFAD